MKKNYHLTIAGLLMMLAWLTPINGYAQYTIPSWCNGPLGRNICWLKWDDILPWNGLTVGQSVTRTIQLGELNITVVLDQIAFSGTAQAPGNPANAKLIGYNVGSKATDGLYEMYSYHYLGGSSAPYGLTPNLLGAGTGLKVNFRITAHATLRGQAMDLNMFFGSNEDGNEVVGAIDDYAQVTTNGSNWKLFAQKYWETAHGSNLAKAVFTNAKKTVRVHVGGGNSAVFHTAKQEASPVAPLEANVEMNCATASSIAFGFLSWYDAGDAPSSYGMAVNKLPFEIQGGDPVGNAATITNYFSWNHGAVNTPQITAGTVPETYYLYPRIGKVGADAESSGGGDGGAIGDDYNGGDEEIWYVPAEGVQFPLNGNTFSYDVPFYKNSANPSQPAYAMVWIDFDHDGVFGPGEYRSYTFTDNNVNKTATFSWDLTAIPYGAGITYTRLRLSYTDPATIPDDPGTPVDERSIAILGEGETEDHFITLTSPNMITGKVVNDANGLTDHVIGGQGTNGGGLWVIAVGSNGKVGGASQVDGSGNFALSNVFNGLYELRLTTVYGYPGQVAGDALLPAGWVAAGEGIAGAGDGTTNAKIGGLNVLIGSPSISNVSFGINRRPVTNSKTFQIANEAVSAVPAGGPAVPGYRGISLASAALTGYPSGGSLAGNDAEDCAGAGSCNVGSTFVIESIKANSKVYYDNLEIVPGAPNATIANFDPAQMVLYGQVGAGETGDAVGFTYSLQDAAGVKSVAAAAFAVNSNTPFPVKLIRFDAQVVENQVQLDWFTAEEVNSDHFEIQHSTDARQWAAIGSLPASRNSATALHYQFIHQSPSDGKQFYRLKMVDADHTFAMSSIREVALNAAIGIFPNPASQTLHVPQTDGREMLIYDLAGRLRLKAKVLNGRVNVSNLENGTYLIRENSQKAENSGRRFVIMR